MHLISLNNYQLPHCQAPCTAVYRISTILLRTPYNVLKRDSILHTGPLADDLPLTLGCMMSFPAVAWIGLILSTSQFQNSTDSLPTAISLQLYGHNDVCAFASFC